MDLPPLRWREREGARIYSWKFKTEEKHHELVKSMRAGLYDNNLVLSGENLFRSEFEIAFSKFENTVMLCKIASNVRMDVV